MVAVKKLLTPMDHSDRLFLDEVICQVKVNHKNVVRFLAYCLETTFEVREVEGKLGDIEVQQRFLCFEYAPNGNLHRYLQDFGLSRRFDENVTTVVTEKIAGTLGYIAPEYIDQGEISLKTDIFSLGIIMIRLLVGHNDTIIENWHGTMDANCPKMKRCIEIAQICVDHDPCKRPTMYDIICALDDIEITVEEDPPIINEPRNDPRSSLYQVVLRFRALPPLGENSRVRVDTLYINLMSPSAFLRE
ncbi:cysteine-rich receptor-like protein kinase 14 isoform X2 [Panicum virgatum]|uniref:cysteine-rich receptor-like protein kinase 14 isoform X2 n=1 Tax=Panicum virgatum TaxID=38727 RepID=UPI0019D4F7C7|nr:cysteine-rich receptor-like protein kinase 14 isoform X2 [Panicum virgatum]